MSEWGIEQPSTFGGCGGCFVEGLSLVCGVGLCVALMCGLPMDKKEKTQDVQAKTESVKSDAVATIRDTVFINSFGYNR